MGHPGKSNCRCQKIMSCVHQMCIGSNNQSTTLAHTCPPSSGLSSFLSTVRRTMLRDRSRQFDRHGIYRQDGQQCKSANISTLSLLTIVWFEGFLRCPCCPCWVTHYNTDLNVLLSNRSGRNEAIYLVWVIFDATQQRSLTFRYHERRNPSYSIACDPLSIHS